MKMKLVVVAYMCLSPLLAQGKRCVEPAPETKARMASFKIIQLCQFFGPTYSKSLLELPTEIITGALPYPLNKAVVWRSRGGIATFRIPDEYEDYSICAYSREQLSEIPKPGEYLKHGWENITERSIDYGWVLKRRGIKFGDTKLRVDVLFSFLPSANLLAARNAGLCMQKKNLVPGTWR